MSLKEITKDLHHEAETTKFAKLLLSGKIEKTDYANYLYQLVLVYNAIEMGNRVEGNLFKLPGIERTTRIYEDFIELAGVDHGYKWLPGTVAYYNYLMDLIRDPASVQKSKHTSTAAIWGIYTVGRLSRSRSHISPKVDSTISKIQRNLKVAIRAELTDDLGDEARVAFEWAIKMMRELYNEPSLEQSN
jgi:hypothetical protein